MQKRKSDRVPPDPFPMNCPYCHGRYHKGLPGKYHEDCKPGDPCVYRDRPGLCPVCRSKKGYDGSKDPRRATWNKRPRAELNYRHPFAADGMDLKQVAALFAARKGTLTYQELSTHLHEWFMKADEEPLSISYLCNVSKGLRAPNATILKWLGLEQVPREYRVKLGARVGQVKKP